MSDTGHITRPERYAPSDEVLQQIDAMVDTWLTQMPPRHMVQLLQVGPWCSDYPMATLHDAVSAAVARVIQ